jgi:feruloyl esterase
VIAFLFAFAATAGVAIAAGAGTPCARLTELAIPDVKIESAAPAAATPQSPESCRVRAVARPTADSEIHIEVWLPAAAAWNGKFLGTGNGGYSGALSYPAMTNALQKGYATAGHDTGHPGRTCGSGSAIPRKSGTTPGAPCTR